MSGRKVMKLFARKSKKERDQEQEDAKMAELILLCPGGADEWERMTMAIIGPLIETMYRQLRKAEELRRKREAPHEVVEMKPKGTTK